MAGFGCYFIILSWPICNRVTFRPVTALGHLCNLHLYLDVSVYTVYTALILCKTPLDTIDWDHTHHPSFDIDFTRMPTCVFLLGGGGSNS